MDKLQDLRPARGAAEERHRAAHDGRREHRVPRLRQAAHRQLRLVAVARPDAREGARADRPLSGQDALDRRRRSRTSRAATCSARCWRASSSGDVDVLIVANPCFGLDFASVAEIRAQIMEQRNRGAAVLLVSEDLDEILELADRVAVMSGGTINYVAPAAETDRTTIGHAHGGALSDVDHRSRRALPLRARSRRDGAHRHRHAARLRRARRLRRGARQ